MGIIVIILLLIGLLILLLKEKNKMNKKIVIGIVIALAIMIIIGIAVNFLSNSSNTVVITSISNIQEREYHKISNNLYYTDDLIENKGHEDKEKILDYYKTISNYLDKKYPTLSFYITNFNYDTLNKDNNGIVFNVYQIIDMAIIDKTMFSIDMENGKVIEYDYSDLGFADSDNFIFSNLKATNNVNIDDAKEKALDLAQQHADEIFTSNSSSRVIKGECYLKYNDENKFYYTVILNNGSYVNIDTITGNVIGSYFFNGIYY